MRNLKIKIPDIPEAEKTPLVEALLEIIVQQAEVIEHQQEQIQNLKDEIAVLKKKKPKPKVKPSKLNKKTSR